MELWFHQLMVTQQCMYKMLQISYRTVFYCSAESTYHSAHAVLATVRGRGRVGGRTIMKVNY
jgi:hypothetical protein